MKGKTILTHLHIQEHLIFYMHNILGVLQN